MVQSLLKNTVPGAHIARSHLYGFAWISLRAMIVAGLSDWYNFGD